MKTTLLIMAAGIGSRFGTGIKQLEPVDDSNHIIMDYSIHDAIEAGFNHVVFIIRKDIEKEFKEVIGDRIASICSAHNVTVDYAFQDINDIPGELPAGRTKPWGTGQAVLAAKDVIKTPFIVINADDYYGKEGFKAVHEYLVNGGKSCMAGFVLKNMVLSGLLFGCMHMNFNQFLYTFVFGMILVFMMEATGSIVTSMICHFLLNLNGVLLSGLNGSIRNASVSDAVQQSSNLASQPKILLAGLLVWGVIAVFTTAGGCAIWVHLARKNGRLELIQQKMNEVKRERIVTPTLVIGMVLAVAFMVIIEIF